MGTRRPFLPRGCTYFSAVNAQFLYGGLRVPKRAQTQVRPYIAAHLDAAPKGSRNTIRQSSAIGSI